MVWISVMELEYMGVEAARGLGIAPSEVSKFLNQVRIGKSEGAMDKKIKEIFKTS